MQLHTSATRVTSRHDLATIQPPCNRFADPSFVTLRRTSTTSADRKPMSQPQHPTVGLGRREAVRQSQTRGPRTRRFGTRNSPTHRHDDTSALGPTRGSTRGFASGRKTAAASLGSRPSSTMLHQIHDERHATKDVPYTFVAPLRRCTGQRKSHHSDGTLTEAQSHRTENPCRNRNRCTRPEGSGQTESDPRARDAPIRNKKQSDAPAPRHLSSGSDPGQHTGLRKWAQNRGSLTRLTSIIRDAPPNPR